MVGQNLSPRSAGASSDTHAAWAVVTAEEMTSAVADGTAVATEAMAEVAEDTEVVAPAEATVVTVVETA